MVEPANPEPPQDASADQSGAGQTLRARLLAEQRRRWLDGDRTPVEDYVRSRPELGADAEAVKDLILQEFVLRGQAGEYPSLGEYLDRFPHLAAELEGVFALEGAPLPPTGPYLGPEAGVALPVLPGYQILGVLGRGGFG